MFDRSSFHYRVGEEIGRGGMGVVHRAEDTRLDRPVALKFLPPDLVYDEQARERFIREARSASVLDHPNICTVHEIGETEEGRFFLAMPLYEGRTLAQHLDAGPLPLADAVGVTLAIARGLEAAHARGIVHRDVKPANVILTDDGQVKLMDFGLALLGEQTRMTAEGEIVGTVSTMSPEQVRGQAVDERTDVWALGCVLHQALTGERPFTGDHPHAVIYAILNLDPKPMEGRGVDVPPELADLVRRALIKDPERRLGSMAEMRAELERMTRLPAVAASQPESTLTAAAPVRRPVRRRALAAVAVLALGAALAGYMMRKPTLIQATAQSPLPVAVVGFENATGDDAYDFLESVLPQLMTTSLEQSDRLRVVTRERLEDVASQLGRGRPGTIDLDLGRSIARREGLAVLIAGRLEREDRTIRLKTRAVDAGTGRVVARADAEGEGVNSLLYRQVDAVCTDLIREFGGDEVGPDEAGRPVAAATSNDLEAYAGYVAGVARFRENDLPGARVALERAVALDSTFAVAHLYLAQVLLLQGDQEGGARALDRAVAGAERVMPKDRLAIEATHALLGEGDIEQASHLFRRITERYPLEKHAHFEFAECENILGRQDEAIAAYLVVLELDPEYAPALNNLAYLFLGRGELDSALDLMERQVRVLPSEANPLDSLGDVQLAMGRLEEAETSFRRAIELSPGFPYPYLNLARTYGLMGDHVRALEVLENYLALEPSPAATAHARTLMAYLQSFRGCRQLAELEIESVVDDPDADAMPAILAHALMLRGYMALDEGETSTSRRAFEEAFAAAQQAEDPVYNLRQTVINLCSLGLVDLADGEVPAAQARLDRLRDMEARLPAPYDDVAGFQATMLAIELMLSSERAEEAVALCDSLVLPAGSSPVFGYYTHLYEELPARSYLAAGRLDEALAEFEALITLSDHRWGQRPVHPVYHLRLGLLYERRGWPGKAIDQYERLLQIWRDAPDDHAWKAEALRRVAVLRGDAVGEG